MGMDISGVSSLLPSKAAGGRNENELTQNVQTNSKDKKYVTVQDENYKYTYIVIGPFQILIGRVAVDKDDDKDKKKDKLKTEEFDKMKSQELFSKNQTEMEYQRLAKVTLPANNFQEGIQAMEECAMRPQYAHSKFDAKG